MVPHTAGSTLCRYERERQHNSVWRKKMSFCDQKVHETKSVQQQWRTKHSEEPATESKLWLQVICLKGNPVADHHCQKRLWIGSTKLYEEAHRIHKSSASSVTSNGLNCQNAPTVQYKHNWTNLSVEMDRACDSRGNKVLTAWFPLTPDLTPCDFFSWGKVRDHIYVPAALNELQNRNITATATIDSDMLCSVCDELQYPIISIVSHEEATLQSCNLDLYVCVNLEYSAYIFETRYFFLNNPVQHSGRRQTVNRRLVLAPL